MKKLALAFILVLSAVLLVGCGSDGAPEGMQLVSGGPDLGYYFYAPEEWTVSNTGDISSVYVSRIDTTSVSFVEIDPKSCFVKPDPQKSDESFFFEDYFESMKAEFPENTKFPEKGEPILLGSEDTKAERAISYTYSYNYDDHEFGFMQIFAAHSGKYYIMTYASLLEEKSDGVTNYAYYKDKLETIIENFTFFTPVPTETGAEAPTPDADGDILISEHKLAGFNLYVPATFSVDYASAIVSATHADGSNVTMTKTKSGGLQLGEYFTERQNELTKLVTDFTHITTVPTTALGNSRRAAAYEYTYVYNGETFHVYQVFAIKGFSGYIFTYTAKEECYSLHIDEVMRMIDKVDF